LVSRRERFAKSRGASQRIEIGSKLASQANDATECRTVALAMAAAVIEPCADTASEQASALANVPTAASGRETLFS
jgi:hypothetical protein